jgi:hypothetical protein
MVSVLCAVPAAALFWLLLPAEERQLYAALASAVSCRRFAGAPAVFNPGLALLIHLSPPCCALLVPFRSAACCCLQKNHLSGLKRKLLKVSFFNVQQLMDVRREVQPTITANSRRSTMASAVAALQAAQMGGDGRPKVCRRDRHAVTAAVAGYASTTHLQRQCCLVLSMPTASVHG